MENQKYSIIIRCHEVLNNYMQELSANNEASYANKSLFIALDKNFQPKFSTSVSILEDTHEAVMILVKNFRRNNKVYNSYDVRHIDCNGTVFENFYQNGWCMRPCFYGTTDHPGICIQFHGRSYFGKEVNPVTWIEGMEEIFHAYNLLKTADNENERELISKLVWQESFSNTLKEQLDSVVEENSMLQAQLAACMRILNKFKELYQELSDETSK